MRSLRSCLENALTSDIQTAGLTLAARLSEDDSTTVLVLEAGEANISDPNLRQYHNTATLTLSSHVFSETCLLR